MTSAHKLRVRAERKAAYDAERLKIVEAELAQKAKQAQQAAEWDAQRMDSGLRPVSYEQ